MSVNEFLVVQILKQLEELSPRSLGEPGKNARDLILPHYEDREEVVAHLIHCAENNWIRYDVWAKSRDNLMGDWINLKITPEGSQHYHYVAPKAN